MAVLNELAKANGGVLRRSDLLDRIWGTSKGSDESLSRAISLSRKALKRLTDSDPIRTVSRSGYRFVAPVELVMIGQPARHSPSPEVEGLYLEGRTLAARVSHPAELAHSVKLLEKAVQLEPLFAEGWAALSQARALAAAHTPFADRLQKIRQAGADAEHAIALDPSDSRPYSVVAQHLLAERDFVGALNAAQKACNLNANDPDAVMWLGYLFGMMGHISRALPLLQKSVALDPLQGRRHMILSIALLVSGKLDSSERHAEIATKLGFFGAQEPFAAAAYSRGKPDLAIARFDAATEHFREIYDREPRLTPLWRFVARGLYGESPLCRNALITALVPISSFMADRKEGLLAFLFLRTGTAKRFFQAFGQRILPGNSVLMLYLWDRTSPTDAIRHSPAFEDFVTNLGMASAWEEYGRPYEALVQDKTASTVVSFASAPRN